MKNSRNRSCFLTLALFCACMTLPGCDQAEPEKPSSAPTPSPAPAKPAAAAPPAEKPKRLSNAAAAEASKPAASAAPAPGTADAPPKTPENAADAIISPNFPGNRVYSREFTGESASLTPASGTLIESGSGLLAPPAPGDTSPANLVKGIKAPNGQAVVQFPVGGQEAYTYWKAGMNMAANLQPIFVEDADGQVYNPVGYMVNKGDKLELKLTPDTGIKSLSQIPGLKDLAKTETLWLVFFIPKGARISRFVPASNKKISLDLAVPR